MAAISLDAELAKNKNLRAITDSQSSLNNLEASRRNVQASINACRPSVLLCAELASHVDHFGEKYWSATYDELQTVGDSPEDAFAAFDRAWQGLD